jgi:hypothetical protein
MATCAILGQALGTAVAMATNSGCPVENVDIPALQQTLMDDDCYIPWHERDLPDLTKNAKCSSETVRNGIERGEENLWIGEKGDFIEYSFENDTDIHEIRLIFDNDMNRQYHNMPCCYPLVETKFKLPKTLIKEYIIEGSSESGVVFSVHVTDNHLRFVKHTVNAKLNRIRFIPISTHGCDRFRLFDFEIK